MNGVMLIARLITQLVVARMKAVLRNVPSGSITHSRVAIAATASSAIIPAQSINNR